MKVSLLFLALALLGCATTSDGIPNLVQVRANVWRSEAQRLARDDCARVSPGIGGALARVD
jgi:uncharacterized lipoprotein YmbA